MVTYANPIEVPVPLAPTAYDGTIEAITFEVAEPGEPENPSKLIATDQDWGVKVNWEMHGILAKFLDATFHLRVLIESIGPGAEMRLPQLVDVKVPAKSVPFTGGQRAYEQKITFGAGQPAPFDVVVPAGTYKLVTLLQLHTSGPSDGPYPVAGMVEGPVVDFFDPA